MGLSNKGFQFYTNISSFSKPYIQSIAPFSSEEMIYMLKYISEHIINPRMIEINLSCPNLNTKSLIAFDSLDEYLEKIQNNNFNNLILGLKLPPYYLRKDFDEVSTKILNSDKIQFITCVNSVINGLIIYNEKSVIHPNNGLGGIGGAFIKPTALANIWQFYQRFKGKVKIIGVGGIENAEDAFEHILCGADLVQIGTQLMKEGPHIFEKINFDFKELLKKKGYNNIDDFKGKLEII
jgi:dihydroorotate dehydrogenase (fumarate)